MYTKVGYEGGEVNVSIATVAFLDGEFAFVGECKFGMVTAPFQGRFGERSTDVARLIVGVDSQTTESLLADPSAPPEQVTILNPARTDPSVLATLELASFNIPDLPESWVGPYTVCTRIELGWSDCVGLSSPDLAAVPVAAYIDPTNPRVETFLVDESANLQAPISQLAAIDVPLELLGTVGDGRTAQLSLELPIGSSVAAVMDRPESGVEGASIVAKATGS